MDKLQRVLNTAVRVVTGTWTFDHKLGQILHNELLWLVFFKLAITVHQSLNGCRTTAVWPPVLTLGGTCVPPTVNCLQYLATGSTLTAVGPFQLPAPV